MTGTTYDVVVAGGGAAGLSGAIALARSRRSVLVVDAGEPRNAPAAGVHNYLGLEGIAPRELVAKGRATLTEYGGEVRDGRITGAERDGDGFRLSLADGDEVRGRRLLVTTGLVDELPEVAGLADRWGRDVLHCPFCHGWEVRDQAIAVLATHPHAALQALMFRQLSDDVVLIAHTSPPEGENAELLEAAGVPVVDGVATELEVTDDAVSGVRLADGRVVPCQAVVVGPRAEARSDILDDLGVEVVEHPSGQGRHVPADPTGATSAPGVFVAGNVTDITGQVMGSAAAGTKAGAAIHMDLILSDLRRD